MKLFTTAAAILAATLPAFAQDQQVGARTKAMGGSYTAFEDDPVSVWLNPAGMATQPDQGTIAYQSYVAYPVAQRRGPGNSIVTSVEAETTMVAPALIPSYLGFVFQVGTPESPMAIGLCFARPYVLGYALDEVTNPTQTAFTPEASVEQELSRFRLAFARDFRFKAVGEPGWFPHLSVGGGLDLGFEQWEFKFADTTQGQNNSDSDASPGGGLGLLLGVYDDTESCKVNVGVAWQSAVSYEFSIEPDIQPAFDMPHQVNVGATFYLLQRTPLRITVDLQWIQWSETAEAPLFPGFEEFDDAVSFSAGLEYRINVAERLDFYPRIGYRRFDAPWGDADDLPMTGAYKLVLDTDDDSFDILTVGAGFVWSGESGKSRSVDVAADVGGDAFNVAMGYTHEF